MRNVNILFLEVMIKWTILIEFIKITNQIKPIYKYTACLQRAYAVESKCFVVVPHTLRTCIVRTLSSHHQLCIMLTYLLHLPSVCIIFYLSDTLSLSLSLLSLFLSKLLSILIRKLVRDLKHNLHYSMICEFNKTPWMKYKRTILVVDKQLAKSIDHFLWCFYLWISKCKLKDSHNRIIETFNKVHLKVALIGCVYNNVKL